MKITKVLCGVLAAGMLFLPSCGAPEVIGPVGIYSYYEAETLMEGDVPRFTLLEDGTYSFHYALHSSFFGFGTYVIDGDTLVLTQGPESDGVEYRFEKKGDSYVFDAENSAAMYPLVDIPDGAVFAPGMPDEEKTPFGSIDPEEAVMFYSVFDGDVARMANLAFGGRSEREEQAEIYEKLREIPVEKVDSADAPPVTAPVYGMQFLSMEKDGEQLFFGWSNGFLYADDGSVWAADIDFPTLMADYVLDWEDEDPGINEMPCAYYMAQTADGWDAEFLRSGEDFVPIDGVTAAVAEVTDGEIVVECTNHGDGNWSVQEDYIVQVKLDGMWYDVPLLPGFHEPVPGDTEVVSGGGWTFARRYSLVPYGILPAGTYRVIVSEDAACEFTVE